MRALLLQANVELKEREFFDDRFSEKELTELIGERPISEMFSWNSPTFKALGIGKDELDNERQFRMMLDEPRLIRRPIVIVDGKVIVGKDIAALERVLL